MPSPAFANYRDVLAYARRCAVNCAPAMRRQAFQLAAVIMETDGNTHAMRRKLQAQSTRLLVSNPRLAAAFSLVWSQLQTSPARHGEALQSRTQH